MKGGGQMRQEALDTARALADMRAHANTPPPPIGRQVMRQIGRALAKRAKQARP